MDGYSEVKEALDRMKSVSQSGIKVATAGTMYGVYKGAQHLKVLNIRMDAENFEKFKEATSGLKYKAVMEGPDQVRVRFNFKQAPDIKKAIVSNNIARQSDILKTEVSMAKEGIQKAGRSFGKSMNKTASSPALSLARAAARAASMNATGRAKSTNKEMDMA